MARYIDADKLKQTLTELYDLAKWKPRELHFSLFDMVGNIDGEPTADVVPVIHAQWGRYNATAQFYCTNCHDLWQGDFDLDPFDDHFYYCPSCGAKMDGVQDG